MDAADLKFFDNTFDVVYAPYLISVVPNPVRWRRRCGACAVRAAASSSSVISSARTRSSPESSD